MPPLLINVFIFRLNALSFLCSDSYDSFQPLLSLCSVFFNMFPFGNKRLSDSRGNTVSPCHFRACFLYHMLQPHWTSSHCPPHTVCPSLTLFLCLCSFLSSVSFFLFKVNCYSSFESYPKSFVSESLFPSFTRWLLSSHRNLLVPSYGI